MVLLTASGTAAMEAAASNLSGETRRVLVLDGGTFGRRWTEILRLYPYAAVDVASAPFGKDPDYGAIEARLKAGGYYALFMQHHETSSGELFDVARLGATCRQTGTLLIVDAISSFLADEFAMDASGIDAAVISSHKGLCLPPGLSVVALGPRMLTQTFRRCTAYGDFTENLRSLERGQPLFTPAAQIFLQLHRRLRGLIEDGGAARRGAVREKAAAFRDWLREDGRTLIPDTPSDCLSSFSLRGPGKALSERLADAGWFVMPSVQTNQLRISHLGSSSLEDHRTLYDMIRQTEHELWKG
jgi:aspartate aminotransferase-like enzyme